MQQVTGRLTVCFENPFWVAVYEQEMDGQLQVARVVFGAQPSDQEVWQYFLKEFTRLRYSPAVPVHNAVRSMNPKKMQRQRVEQQEIGTRAQQALQLQREKMARERKQHQSRQRQQEQEEKFLIRQAKKKEKHRGR